MSIDFLRLAFSDMRSLEFLGGRSRPPIIHRSAGCRAERNWKRRRAAGRKA